MSDTEVMTTAIVAALFFGGNFTTACDFLKTHKYILNMLSKSRFNRRLHRIKHQFITPLNAFARRGVWVMDKGYNTLTCLRVAW